MKHLSDPDHLQPPELRSPVTPYLRDSLAKLMQQADAINAVVAQEAAQETATKKAHKTRQDRTHTDYRVQVKEWFESLPPASRQRRYRAHELLPLFAGRYRDRPAIMMIGAALRANGFTPHRDWTVAGRNSRYWLPPSNA